MALQSGSREHVDVKIALLAIDLTQIANLDKLCWIFLQAPNENGEDSDSDDDSMDEEGQGMPSSLGQRDMSMELEPSSAQGSKATRQEEKAPTLTEEEMADGWQEAPTRSRRRGGKRT